MSHKIRPIRPHHRFGWLALVLGLALLIPVPQGARAQQAEVFTAPDGSRYSYQNGWPVPVGPPPAKAAWPRAPLRPEARPWQTWPRQVAKAPARASKPAKPPAAKPPAAKPPAAPVRRGPKPIIIRNDGGGNLNSYVSKRARLAASGRPIEFRGKCNSACTILLTLPNSCMKSNLQIGFHRPDTINIPGAAEIAEAYWTQRIGGYYRNGVRDMWFRKWSKSKKYTVISAKKYVRLDPQAKLCPKG